MLKPTIALLCASLCSFSLSCDEHENKEPVQEECGETLHPINLAIRHIEANGIGYKEGYTTLEGFFTPIDPNSWFGISNGWLPFIDVRAHVFNDGRPAINAGFGLRRLASHVCWGMNAYYDCRKTAHRYYNQAGLGIEALGRIWDFRINGYLPFGETESSPYHYSQSFQGNYLYISERREIALKAVNAEIGLHVSEFGKSRLRKTYDSKPRLYLAAGPYYLNGHGESSWGGQARIALDIYEYIRIEANTSYDNLFHAIGQGQLTLRIPLGAKRKITPRKGESCARARMFSERGMQRVDRFEIIPLDHKEEKTPAINPATGDPWFFLFVDNTSHSAGTYESPYPTLLAVQNASSPNDVIYVFPGDGTSTGMDQGIILKNGQMLLGASIPQPIISTKGPIIIPPLASGFPYITNITGDVVTLANNNTISGFNVGVDFGNGLSGIAISNLFADQNNFIANVANANGFFLLNPTGEVLISNSTFEAFTNTTGSGMGNAIYAEVDFGTTLDSFTVLGSNFSDLSDPGSGGGGAGIIANLSGGTLTNWNISDCAFTDITSFSIIASIIDGTLVNWRVSDSNFSNISDVGSGVIALMGGGSITNMTVTNTTFDNFSGSSSSIACVISGGPIDNLSVTNNTFSNMSSTGNGLYYTNGYPTDNTFVEVANNTFTGGSGIAVGFGASISVSSGTTCLEFINNTASPITSPDPYMFSRSGSGILNRTTGSDSSTNIGAFSIGSGVGAPGSCSE